MSSKMRAVLAALLVAICSAQKITSLPGLAEMPSFGMYSGYVSIPNSPRNLFYIFVESASPTQPDDPVVVWMNGGPGCSSLLGWSMEHGPFRVQPDGMTLKPNNYSWNAVANMIYVEAPSGVGFSYGTNNNYTTGDDQTAADNLEFLFGWFKQFPQYVNNDFYVAGESFAGNYVPELAYNIYLSNQAGVNPYINMKGFLVGNPTFDSAIIAQNYYPFLHGKSIISIQQYQTAQALCNNTFYPAPNQECSAYLSKLVQQTYDINPYNIDGPCLGVGPGTNAGCFTMDAFATETSALKLPKTLSQTFIPCLAVSQVRNYFNLPEVQAALHTSPLAVKPWDACSQVLHYNQYISSLHPIYLTLEKSIRILVYSGDVDSCVPELGTEACVLSLGLPTTDPWRTWSITDTQDRPQVAGKTQKFGNLVFATVRGAGHMVPSDRPLEALALFSKFIADKPL